MTDASISECIVRNNNYLRRSITSERDGRAEGGRRVWLNYRLARNDERGNTRWSFCSLLTVDTDSRASSIIDYRDRSTFCPTFAYSHT